MSIPFFPYSSTYVASNSPKQLLRAQTNNGRAADAAYRCRRPHLLRSMSAEALLVSSRTW